MNSRSINMRAFTLIEMMMVIAITGIVGLAISNMILFTYRTNTYLYQQTAATDNARRGVEFALQNLREATFGADGAYPVASAATSSVYFYADVDTDGSVEKVRYFLSNGTLYRGVINPAGSPPSYTGQSEATTTIAAYVKNFAANAAVFHYYTSGGVELTPPVDTADIKTIGMSIMVDIDPNKTPTTYTLTGSATLRNLRDTE